MQSINLNKEDISKPLYGSHCGLQTVLSGSIFTYLILATTLETRDIIIHVL